MKMHIRIRISLAAAAAFIGTALTADAATRTWLGVDAAWTNTANWSGGSVPENGDEVVIPDLANDPAMPAGTYPASGAFASFALDSGAVVTCEGDTNAINAASGGTSSNKHGIGVTIHVNGDATIAGALSADGQGFPLTTGPGGTTSSTGIGASHGGLGGRSSAPVYGSTNQPTALGSSTGKSRGGGAIRLNVVGLLTVNGRVSADAVQSDNNPNGGSGGSVWLACGMLAGSGTISADGHPDSANYWSGGGGGRVAIDYTNSTFTGTVSAAGGPSANAGDGQPGTLWEPMRFDGLEGSPGSPASVTVDSGYQYVFTNGTSTLYWDLTVDGEWVEFHQGRLAIGTLMLTNGATLRFDNAKGGHDAFGMESLSIGDNIDLRGESALYLSPEGLYVLSGDLHVEAGSTLYVFGNTTNVNAVSGGTTNEPHGTGVRIDVAGNATVAGAINGDGLGFPYGEGPGRGPASGDGASHGGAGASAAYGPYGLLTRPTALGSGGSQVNTDGGGAVALNIDGTLTLNGAISMDGTVGNNPSGSSGGSIWLRAATLTGGGTISAVGGGGKYWYMGGGGRIAIDYASSTFTGSVSVAGGQSSHSSAKDGRTGTVFVCESAYAGTYSSGYDGIVLFSAFDVSSNDMQVTRVVNEWRGPPGGVLEWSDTATDTAGAARTNTATYTITGLVASVQYNVWTNGVMPAAATYVTDPNGVLTISNIVFSSAVTTRVESLLVAPVIENREATNWTATSGWLNGYLQSTGTAETTVSLYWGTSDGGDTDSGLWAHTNTWPAGTWGEGSYPTYHATGITNETFVYYRYRAVNAGGVDASSFSSWFMAGSVWITAPDPDAAEDGEDPGTLRIQRDGAATNEAIDVPYAVLGTAELGNDYTLSPPGTNVTLAAGVSSADITVNPNDDVLGTEPDETVVLTLLEGGGRYPLGSPRSNTVTIANRLIPPGTNVTQTTGSWTNPAVWSLARTPVAGDDVRLAHDLDVPAGTYPVAGSFAALYVGNGVTATCLGDTNSVNSNSGGSPGNPHGIGVTINVDGDVTIDGTMNGEGQGFAAKQGPAPATRVQIGASHGGRGVGTSPYGQVARPTALGSGGTSWPGGGALKVDVTGALTLNGAILMDADPALDNSSGGAGGSVWLHCNHLAGGGSVSAEGGGSLGWHGGGGGRVAIEYLSSSFTGTISVTRGISTYATPWVRDGQPGTLWEPQWFAGREGSAGSPRSLTISNDYQYYFTNTTGRHYWDLTVDGAWVEFHGGDLVLTNLSLTNTAALRFDAAMGGTDAFDMRSLAIGGGIHLDPASRLHLPAEGRYALSGDLLIDADAALYTLGNTTNANAASGGTELEPHGIGVTIEVAGNATVAGAINGDGLGFRYGEGPGRGPTSQDGASHGGAGASAAYGSYGSLTRPTALGSGGSVVNTDGGGAVTLHVDGTLTLDGAITANGTMGNNPSGSSGGSIWLRAATLTGGGTVAAKGGSDNYWMMGGGGRIAIEYASSTFTGTVSAAAGLSSFSPDNHGQTGTVFTCRSPYPATCSTGYQGVAVSSAFATSSNDVGITRTVSAWRGSPAKLHWTDASTDSGGSVWRDNTADYTIGGLAPFAVYFVYTNDVMLAPVSEADADGVLAVSGISLTGPTSVRVEAAPTGSLIMVR